MSQNIARDGDLTTGHGCHPPQTIIATATSVFINGRPVARLGDQVTSHTCGDDTHGGYISNCQSKVIVEGIPLARVGDSISCGGTVMTGSDNCASD